MYLKKNILFPFHGYNLLQNKLHDYSLMSMFYNSLLYTDTGQNSSAMMAGRPGMLGMRVVWRSVSVVPSWLQPTVAATSNLTEVIQHVNKNGGQMLNDASGHRKKRKYC